MAIACQGGGSHTAFTAGVLGRLLTADEFDEYELVGLSGTSGGAVCAALAWSALLDGDPADSKARLDGFWADNAASGPVEMAINAWVLWAATLQSVGLLPAVSPYDVPVTGLEHFRTLLRRWVDFDRIQVDGLARHPILLIGAVDVLSGEFRAFNSRRERITAGMVLASAAIPTAFRTVRTAGGSFWDGLFSQNPPVRELLDARPDELWVVQINPTTRSSEPRSVLAIADRRNELAGNLSLYQELHVIEKIDQLLDEGLLTGDRYKQVTVRVVQLPRLRSSRWFGPASKVNRDRRFLRRLIREGGRQADTFLTALAFERAWHRGDADELVHHLADDAELTFTEPFRERGPVRGRQLHEVMRTLSEDVRIDVTRKQVTGSRTAWTVRTGSGDTASRACAEAEFRDNRIVRLRLGSAPPT
ncbi:patatin-like phospholipase family protein [Geodermatophilus sp. URMC 61]|uniref:patatin-like phospholipase family protein n=1 Tax=Geodermatophilus sp. URMC 61 TaxID=3423411 RepID=UPI00406C2773